MSPLYDLPGLLEGAREERDAERSDVADVVGRQTPLPQTLRNPRSNVLVAQDR